MRNNRRYQQSSASTAPKQSRNDDPEGLGWFGKGLLDARGARDFWWNVFTGPIYVTRIQVSNEAIICHLDEDESKVGKNIPGAGMVL